MADIIQTFPFIFQTAATGNGNGTAVNCGGLPFVMAQITGLGVATINFEGTTEVSTFNNAVSVEGYNVTTGSLTSAATVNGLFLIPTSGLSQIRCRISGYSSGTIAVTGVGTTTGSAPVKPGSSNRSAGVLHRSAITAADVLPVPVVSAASAVTEAGSTLPNSALNYSVAAGNRWGVTTAAATQAITPTANQAVRIPIAQSVLGGITADYYDIFLSTAASPLWVGRITEAQRAAGGFIISAVGTVTAGGGAGAGAVDIGIQGTGVAYNSTNFAQNNAFVPPSVTSVNCGGYTQAHILMKLALTDLRSAPSALVLTTYLANQVSSGDWHAVKTSTFNILTAVGNTLEQDATVEIDGATGLVVLVQAISGQGAACSVWVELA